MHSQMNFEQQSNVLKEFIPSIQPLTQKNKDAWWFIFRNNQLLVEVKNGNITLPRFQSPDQKNLYLVRKHYLGQLGEVDCYSGEINPDASLPSGYKTIGLRQIFGMIGDDFLAIAGRAVHILYWDSITQFCGRCGHTTHLKTDERAKECPQCGLITYPQLSPAVIILIEKGRELLLARSPRFSPGMYSVIAGFVEPGETLEQAVIREIREEVGIEVHNIRYFASQHWPFPQSLMIAFVAEYLKGQIKIDHKEIEDAKWFTPEELPTIPGKMSISRRLIDWFIEKNQEPNVEKNIMSDR